MRLSILILAGLIGCNQAVNTSLNPGDTTSMSSIGKDSLLANDIYQSLQHKILQADSILLVSHISPPFVRVNDTTNYEVVYKGKVNPGFIKERKIIDDSSRNYLAHFITRPYQDSIIEEGQCFQPRHTIYLFSELKISWIDICFSCEEILSSEDIKFPEGDFDRATWDELKKYFESEGFKYGLDL